MSQPTNSSSFKEKIMLKQRPLEEEGEEPTDDLERSCRSAIDLHVQHGGLISFGAYGRLIRCDDDSIALEDNCGCGLSIMTVAEANEKSIRLYNIDSAYYTILSVLSLSRSKADQFIAGFDGVDVEGAARYQNDSSLSDWMFVGKRIRDYVMKEYKSSIRGFLSYSK